MSPKTATWVDTRSTKVRPSATVAAVVADARRALDATDPEVTRSLLHAILDQAEGLADSGIPVADAAEALGVSEPTVRSWLERGVLVRVDGPRPVKVTPSSLGEAVAAVSTIRTLEGDNPKMRHVLDALEDRRTRSRLQGSLAELAAGDVIEVDPADIAKLFE
jgi:DNA-binding FadR family transcriptional regulator